MSGERERGSKSWKLVMARERKGEEDEAIKELGFMGRERRTRRKKRGK